MNLRNGSEWRAAVFRRDGYRCSALQHDPRCQGEAAEAHHACYLSHITSGSRWVPENGFTLSMVCHMLAHQSHNANLDPERLIQAVNAVNEAMDLAGDKIELRRPHFQNARIAT